MAIVDGIESLSGAKLYVAAAIPATEDKAGYKALTWQEVKGFVTMDEWGGGEADVSESVLPEGRVIHMNGPQDSGSVGITVQHRAVDEGADLIKVNKGSNNQMSFRKVYPSGDSECAYGVVTSPRSRGATDTTVRGFSVTARINSDLFESTAAEWAAP